jgi:hypothetical protein
LTQSSGVDAFHFERFYNRPLKIGIYGTSGVHAPMNPASPI